MGSSTATAERLTRRHSLKSPSMIVGMGDIPRKAFKSAFVWAYLYFRTPRIKGSLLARKMKHSWMGSTETGFIGEKTTALLAKLKKILPNIDARAEFRWTGRFAESPAAPMSSLFWMPEATVSPFQRL
jgi:hypothetical protein